MPLKQSLRVLLGVPCTALISVGSTSSLADEPLPPLRINGIALEVVRMSGPDVTARILALEALWRSRGDAVLPWREQGGWRVLAHRSGALNEVLQVRGGNAAREAFLSRVDVQRAPYPVPVLPLPAGCRAGSTVESGAGLNRAAQVTGQCAVGTAARLDAWSTGLVASGWKGGAGPGESVFRFRRGADELVVIFDTGRRAGAAHATHFTALQRQPGSEANP